MLARTADGRMTLPYWMIHSGEVPQPPVLFTGIPLADPEAYERAGLWHAADTLPELANRIGVPPDALVETVTRFNELAAAGDDPDFGRGREPYDRSVPGCSNPLVPIEAGPFRAAAFGLSDLGTKGGLRTDIDGRVLDSEGLPIPALYAAGNSMAAVSGTTYPGGGNPVGASMVFAHRAACHIAKSARPKT